MSRRDCIRKPGWTQGCHIALALILAVTTVPIAADAHPSTTLQLEKTEASTQTTWRVQLKDETRELLANLRLDGDRVIGRIAVGGRAGEEANFTFNEIVSIENNSQDASAEQGAKSVARPMPRLLLRDGSQIAATKLDSDGQAISINEAQSIESRLVEEIQFAEPDEEQLAAWNEFAQAELSADLLVIKNSAGELTKIEGIVSEFSADAVMFEFSGQIIPVPLPRVVGVRFYSTSVQLAEPVGVLADRRGNRLNFVSVKSITEEGLEVTLGTGTTYRLSVNDLVSIDLSQSGTKYLSDLKVLREEPSPSAILELSKRAGSRRTLLRRNAASKIPGTAIQPSLDFLAAGAVTFEVPEKFKRLSGSVALRPSGSFCTPTRVEIWLEGDRVWEAELIDPQEAESFSLPLKEDARLRLVAIPIGEFPVGTVVRWSSAELTRE